MAITIPMTLLTLPTLIEQARDRAVSQSTDILLERVQSNIRARAYRTGALERSARIFHAPGSDGVEVDIFYAGYIERGTKNADGSERIAPRWYARDALRESTPPIVALFKLALTDSLKGGA